MKLSIEWILLENICLPLNTDHQKKKIEDFIKVDCIQWGELLEQALRHKMLPMLAFCLTSIEFVESLPIFIKRHLYSILELNKHRIKLFRKETSKIIKALNEYNVKFVSTKGITFESTIYENNGIRFFSDVDFMIAPQCKSILHETMRQLNFSIGKFDWKTGKVKSLSRDKMTIFKLNSDHLPKFVSLTEDSLVPYVQVDFATNLTWTRSPFNVPIEDALTEIVYQPIPGISDVQMPCFNSKFQFIFTILHLFREAWVFREGWVDTLYNGWENDVHLSKFADVIRLWRAYKKELNTPEFIQLLEKYEITNAILWVLEHTDRTFNTNIVPTLGLEGRVTEEWLHSAGGVGGKLIQWKGTMRERLYCKDRRKLFITDSEN